MSHSLRNAFQSLRRASRALVPSLALLLAFAGPARAAVDEDNRKLITVISSGLQRAFKIDSQRLQLEEAQNKQWISYSGLLPSLNLLSTRTYAGTDQYDANGKWSYAEGPVDQLRLSANWTLWDGYQAITNVKTGRTQLESTRVNSDIQVQQFVVSLLQAYFVYQLSVTSRDIQAAQVEQSRLTSDQSQALVKAGVKNPIDAMDAEIQVANDEVVLLDRENAIALAARNLQALVNADRVNDLQTFNLGNLDLLHFEPYYMEGFERVLEQSRHDAKADLAEINPDLRKAKIDLQTQQLNLTQTKLSLWPKTQVVLMHDLDLDGYQALNPMPGQVNPIQNYSIGLSLTWQFWDWMATPYTVENSQKDYDISLNTFHDTGVQTRTTIENLISQLDVSSRAINADRVVAQKAEAQLKLSEEMYRSGRINLLMMQQSTSRVYQVRNDLATRLADRYQKAAQLLYATGHSLLPSGTVVGWMK